MGNPGTEAPLTLDVAPGHTVAIDAKPGTGAAADELRLWLGEKELHPHQDCIRVRAALEAKVTFPKGSHLVNGETEEHYVYGRVSVEKNGAAIVTDQAWTPAVNGSPINVGDFSIMVGGTEILVELANVKVDDIVKFSFTELYWLTLSGRSHEFDHGDPNVVIKVVNQLPTSEAYPPC